MESLYDQLINNPFSQASKSLVNFLLPATVKAGQKTFQDIGEGKDQRMTKQEALATALGPLGQYLFGSDRQKQASKAGAEVASYVVPFGKGTSFLNKFLLPGAVSGGLRSASEENVTPESLLTGASGGAIGAGLTGGAFNLLGKAGGVLTKKAPASIMNKIFKEPLKATRASIKSGETLGQKALQKGVKGSEETILSQAAGKMDDLEGSVQNLLNQSKETVDINDLLKTAQPLIDKYKKAGNEAAAKALENRLMNIWQTNGEKIPVAAANEIKRTLYNEVGNAYGQVGSEGVEGIKSVARGIKETIAKKVPEISKLNEELGFWGRTRDAMTDQLARSGRNQFPGLRDVILGAGGIAGAPASGGLSLLPFLMSLMQTTGAKTNTANLLNKVGQGVSKSNIPSALSQILGVTGAQVGSRVGGQSVVPSTPNSPDSNNANAYNSEPAHTQSVPQGSNQGVQDGQLSPGGQWRFDANVGDWVPNQPSSDTTGAQGGLTKEMIGQVMLLDLARSGGKNIGDLKTLSEFILPDSAKKKPLTAVQQQLATNVDSANRSIDKVEEILGKDPNITLKASLPGVGSRLAGASTYNTARKEIADVLARMRTGAVINDEEMANYLSKLPQVGDRPEDTTYKLSELRLIFRGLRDRLENQSGADITINQQ